MRGEFVRGRGQISWVCLLAGFCYARRSWQQRGRPDSCAPHCFPESHRAKNIALVRVDIDMTWRVEINALENNFRRCNLNRPSVTAVAKSTYGGCANLPLMSAQFRHMLAQQPGIALRLLDVRKVAAVIGTQDARMGGQCQQGVDRRSAM